jgi:protein gp37
MRHHPSRQGLTVPSKAGPVWNGTVRFNEDWLLEPLKWRKPRRIFVCAHGDLFHENVPDEWIDQVFAVIALCSPPPVSGADEATGAHARLLHPRERIRALGLH